MMNHHENQICKVTRRRNPQQRDSVFPKPDAEVMRNNLG